MGIRSSNQLVRIPKFRFLILVLLLMSCESIDDKLQLKLQVVTAEVLGPNESIFVAGNHKYLGDWSADLINLEAVNDSLWEINILFPKDTLLEFKFTKGDWNSEALDVNGMVPQNHRIALHQDTTLKFYVHKWKDKLELDSMQVTGTVEVVKDFEVDGLEDRDISIWLPPGYNDSEESYPVLYVHDGQNVFDKSKAGYNMEWRLDETSDSLIRNEIIRPFIAVAIDNGGSSRFEEYSDTEKGSLYRNFLINDLKPFIDKNYRTLPDRNHTATLGSSMGGLVSFILVWEHDSTFSKAACYSPAFKFQDYDYTEKVQAYNGMKKDITLYLDNGGLGLEKELQPGIDKMMDILKKKDYSFSWHLFPNDEHNEIAWAGRLDIALKELYGF